MLDLRNIEIRGGVALSIRSTPHLVVLRCLDQSIRKAIGIQPSDRDTIIRRLTTILTEGVPLPNARFSKGRSNAIVQMSRNIDWVIFLLCRDRGDPGKSVVCQLEADRFAKSFA